MADWFVVSILRFVIEGDVDGHRFLRSLLSLVLNHALGRLRSFEGKKCFVDARAHLVHLGLQLVQIFVQAGIDDFIDAREGEIRAKLA